VGQEHLRLRFVPGTVQDIAAEALVLAFLQAQRIRGRQRTPDDPVAAHRQAHLRGVV